MTKTAEENRLVDVHALEQAMAEICDIDTLRKIMDRKNELLSEIDERLQ